MNTKRFLIACVVTAAALLPFAPWYAVLTGVALAGVATWAAGRWTRGAS